MVPDLETMLEGVTALYAMITLLQEHHIYTQTTRSNPRVVRVEPPLMISSEEVDRFLAAVDDCCRDIDFTNDLMRGVIAKSGLGPPRSHPARRTSRRDAAPLNAPHLSNPSLPRYRGELDPGTDAFSSKLGCIRYGVVR